MALALRRESGEGRASRRIPDWLDVKRRVLFNSEKLETRFQVHRHGGHRFATQRRLPRRRFLQELGKLRGQARQLGPMPARQAAQEGLDILRTAS